MRVMAEPQGVAMDTISVTVGPKLRIGPRETLAESLAVILLAMAPGLGRLFPDG